MSAIPAGEPTGRKPRASTPAQERGGEGVLYLSYDGMLEPLGQSQVVAYLERLAADRPIHLVSFEKPDAWADAARREAMAKRIAAAGIAWRPLPYHKRPSALATAYDIARGIAAGTALVRRHGLGIVHARSYVPAAMALAIKRLTGAKFLFDMRGLWADERVDGGLWPREGYLYRIAKGFERRFLTTADAIVSLTEAGKREIESFPYLAERRPRIAVIPTCADLERFRPLSEAASPDLIVGYVGGARTWYLFPEALAVFRALKAQRSEARLLILNHNEHDFIRASLGKAGIAEADVELRSVEHSDMPAQMARMDVGLVLIKQAYSKIASAPTKLAEFLGCGVPCLVNSGVGDMAEIIAGHRVGVVIDDFSDTACDDAVGAMLALVADPATRQLCVEAARRHFSLEAGVSAYADLYRSLAEPAGPRRCAEPMPSAG